MSLLSAGAAHAIDAGALPQGGTVVGGSAAISRSGSTLTVDQASSRTVIDWRSFDIGSGSRAVFNQPNSSAIAVNRVNAATDPTRIEGALSANGQVWILNPNGVMFGKTATINVAGLLASTANLDPARFMAGDNRLAFTGSDRGSVVNEGSITIAENGLAAFVAPSVRNSGLINARVGKVTLAAGATFTLDLAGDRLVELGLGANEAVVDQSGKIVDEGGVVTLTARSAGQVVDSVVNMSGVINASSATAAGGQVVLGADNITTTASAVLNADGAGAGGSVIAVANKTGDYAGTFSARGGALGGDGGHIETSGQTVHIDGGIQVDTRAVNGLTGDWTLDPANLVIGSGSDGGLSGGTNGEQETIGADTVVAALNTTNVNLQATNSITVDTGATIDTRGQTSNTTLHFKDQDSNGHLTVDLKASILLGANQHLTGDADLVNVSSGALIQNGVDVAASGATVDVAAGTYNESVFLNKAGLTLQSTVKGGAIIDAAGALYGIDVASNAGNLGILTVNGFKVQGWTSVGIDQSMAAGADATMHVENNSVYGPSGGATAHGNGIEVTGDNSVVSGNDVHLVHLNSPNWSGSGIIVANASGVTVDNNMIDGADTGIAVSSYGDTNAMDGITISNNQISHAIYEGISVQAFEGEYFGTPSGPVTNLKVTGNTVTDSVSGLGIWDYSSNHRADWASTVSAISGNNFSGNATQISTDFTGADLTPLLAANHFDASVINATGGAINADDSTAIYGDLQTAIDEEAAGSTLNLAGTFALGTIANSSNGVTVNKDGDTLDGQQGAVITAGGSGNAIGISADRVTVKNLEIDINPGASSSGNQFNAVAIFGTADSAAVSGLKIRGEITAPYTGYSFGSAISRGVAIGNGATNFTISGNDIRNVRNGILIDGRNTGRVTGNTIDNTKGAISVQYTDGTGYDKSLPDADNVQITFLGNLQGAFGNEWGINYHLNGYWNGTAGDELHPNANPVVNGIYLANAPSTAWQQGMLDQSAANGGMTIQDQAYASSNRTAVTVAANGSTTNQGSALNPLASIQAGINAVVTGGTVNVLDGTYTLPGELDITKSLMLKGQSEAGTIINSNSTGYGIFVDANNTSLSNFTYNASASGTYGLKIQAVPGSPSNRLLDFDIDHVTINNSKKTGLDLNGVNRATIDNVTVTGTIAGNGIALTDSANIAITNTSTSNNAWGGLALYQTNAAFDQKESGITVDGSDRFNEVNGIYAQDQSSTNDFGTITLNGQGLEFVATSATGGSDGTYYYFQTTAQGAIDLGAASDTRYGVATATVQGYGGQGVAGDNHFTVGFSSGNQALSIQAAINGAIGGAVIDVGAGTYTQALNIGKNVDIRGAGADETFILPTSLFDTHTAHKYDTDMKVAVFVNGTSNVKLSGLTIDGSNTLGANALVFWNNASGSISDAVIKNVGTFNGDQTGQGLAVDSTGGNAVSLTLTGVDFSNWNKNAIDVVTGGGALSGGGNVTLAVNDSTFTGQDVSGINTQNGIVLWEHGGGTINATVDGSTFTGIASLDDANPAADILVYGSPNGTLTVSNSSFADTATYIALDSGSGHAVNATQNNIFGGVNANTASLDELFAIQDRLLDGLNSAGNGLIRLNAGQVYVTAANGNILAGINAATAGDTVNLQNGTYTVTGGYINVNKALSLIGQSQAGVTINARNASTYGLRVTATDGPVTLSNFTLLGVNNLARNGYGLKAEATQGLTITNVTSKGADKSEFDLNGVVGATLDHLTADGLGTAGNGIAFTDSQNIVLTNSVTQNNAWGGLALYQSNSPTGYTLQETGITVAGNNTFTEANAIYAEDQSSTHDFGTLNISGFDYLVKSPTNPADVYTWFQRTQQNAIDFAAAQGLTTAYVEGYGSGVTGNNVFTVGFSSGGQALSIQAAINAARSGAVLNIASGTYGGNVASNLLTTFNFGNVNLGGAFTLQGGAAGSALSGQLTANAIDLGSSVLLAGDLALASGSIRAGTIDGGHALTVNGGSVSLGALGSGARLGIVNVTGPTTLTGATYNASGFSFGGDVTLTAATTTFDTGGAGSIAMNGGLFGSSDGAQAVQLLAGSGSGGSNGDIVLQNVGVAGLRLGNMTVRGGNFDAQTVRVGNFDAVLTGNQVFSSHTLNAQGTVSSTVGGDASGPINATDAVNFNVGGDVTGAITGSDVSLTADSVTAATVNASGQVNVSAGQVSNSSFVAPTFTANANSFDATVAASNHATVTGTNVSGSFSGGSIKLVGSGTVNAQINAQSLSVQAPQGKVAGNWTSLDAGASSGGVTVNNQPVSLVASGASPNQLVVENFALPAGTTVSARGDLILPQGVVIGLLSPGGAGGAPKMIQVQTVQDLGSLLAQGYTAIVIDLSSSGSTEKAEKEDAPLKVSSR